MIKTFEFYNTDYVSHSSWNDENTKNINLYRLDMYCGGNINDIIRILKSETINATEITLKIADQYHEILDNNFMYDYVDGGSVIYFNTRRGRKFLRKSSINRGCELIMKSKRVINPNDPYDEENWNEGVKWYSNGKLTKDETWKDVPENTFKIGDMVKGVDVIFWHDGGSGTINQSGKWEVIKGKKRYSEVSAVGYCENKKGYSGQIIKLHKCWPWYQTSNFEYEVGENSNEGVKWYSKGKLTKDDSWEDDSIEVYNDHLPDDFRKFLIDNNAYEVYMENVIKDDKNSEVFFDTVRPENLISGVFNWSSSPQRLPYWGRLSKKWVNQIYDYYDYEDSDDDLDVYGI